MTRRPHLARKLTRQRRAQARARDLAQTCGLQGVLNALAGPCWCARIGSKIHVSFVWAGNDPSTRRLHPGGWQGAFVRKADILRAGKWHCTLCHRNTTDISYHERRCFARPAWLDASTQEAP